MMMLGLAKTSSQSNISESVLFWCPAKGPKIDRFHRLLIYIYIYKKRERERGIYRYMYVCVCACVRVCICI